MKDADYRYAVDYWDLLGHPNSHLYHSHFWHLGSITFHLDTDDLDVCVEGFYWWVSATGFYWWVSATTSITTEEALNILPPDWQEKVLFNLDMF